MTPETGSPQYAKISREFVRRLANVAPEQKIRAIVMLRTGDAATVISRRGSGQREALIQAARRQAEAALPDIDRLLDQFGGKRLSREVDALGGVSVETTAAGILGLTSLVHVRVVLEDQEISFTRQ